MYLAIIGNHPRLSLAELESLYQKVDSHSETTATFSGDIWPHMGGSGKVGKIVDRLPTTDPEAIIKYLEDSFPRQIDLPWHKFAFGVSIYGRKLPSYQHKVINYKKHLRGLGYKPRFILGDNQQLSTAQVLHNGLHESGYEILISIGRKDTVIARTTWVQDINSYSLRDMERPVRDMDVGMLPPKLAQIMINLSGGDYVFDPFCGSGVIIQEALLMGKRAGGSDISSRMVEATGTNLAWLSQHYHNNEPEIIETADARKLQLPKQLDSIVTEIYLGPIINSQLDKARLQRLAEEASSLIEDSLRNWHPQLKKGARICLAAPSWKFNESEVLPPLIDGFDDLEALGYNQVRFSHIEANDLTYRRADQYVGRRIILLEKI